MKIKKKTCFGIMILILLLVVSCSSTSRSVERISVDDHEELTGNWSNLDSKLVAEQMIQDLLYKPWISNFRNVEDRNPLVIIGTIRNLSSEHIETDTFVKDIQREMINSNRVDFVASKQEREEIREERMEQQSYASDETAKKIAAESGADFILKGSIKSIIDALDNKAIKYYQVDLELMDIETNKIVWIKDKKIHKIITKSKYKW